MSYAIEVQRVGARLVAWDGKATSARFFLRTASEHHAGPETLLDRLNDPHTQFLACEIDGRVELVRLAWIGFVEVEGELPEVREREEVGACHQAVELILVSGEVLAGELLYLLPPDSSRVSDLLNSPGERFLLLRSAGRTHVVNRDAVARVRS